MMMASLSEMEIEGDVIIQPEDEPDKDNMDQQVQSSLKFRNFYDQIDFSAEQRLAITKAIINLTDPSGGCGVFERRPRGGSILKTAIVFYRNDMQDIHDHHNWSLYVTASVRDVDLICVMVDPGSSVNVIPLSILKTVGVPRDGITKQHIKVASFEGSSHSLLTLLTSIGCRANEHRKTVPRH